VLITASSPRSALRRCFSQQDQAAKSKTPLAAVVIGGLVSSSCLTLFVLPALYSMFERESQLKSKSD
jgi:Cu/Ag efflux pump CusA